MLEKWPEKASLEPIPTSSAHSDLPAEVRDIVRLEQSIANGDEEERSMLLGTGPVDFGGADIREYDSASLGPEPMQVRGNESGEDAETEEDGADPDEPMERPASMATENKRSTDNVSAALVPLTRRRLRGKQPRNYGLIRLT